MNQLDRNFNEISKAINNMIDRIEKLESINNIEVSKPKFESIEIVQDDE